MLDKSLPFMDIIMKAKKEDLDSDIDPLAEGYSYRMYRDGDEIPWAEIQTAVGEFDSFEDAITYFNRVFLPYTDYLYDRMCFIVDEDENFVATATAWFKEDEIRRYPLLHWVSTDPKYQGRGFGTSVSKYAVRLFNITDPEEDEIFLHAHTWGYRFVGLGYKMGFRVSMKPLLNRTTHPDFMDIIEKELPKKITNDLMGEDE